MRLMVKQTSIHFLNKKVFWHGNFSQCLPEPDTNRILQKGEGRIWVCLGCIIIKLTILKIVLSMNRELNTLKIFTLANLQTCLITWVKFIKFIFSWMENLYFSFLFKRNKIKCDNLIYKLTEPFSPPPPEFITQMNYKKFTSKFYIHHTKFWIIWSHI